MFDQRYPNLHRIQYAPGIAYAERHALNKWAQKVGSRTQTTAVYDALHRSVFWFKGEPIRGVHRVAAFDTNNFPRKFGQREEDHAVSVIRSALVPIREKDAIDERMAAEAESAKAAEKASGMADVRRDAEDLLNSKRSGRKSLVVNGSR